MVAELIVRRVKRDLSPDPSKSISDNELATVMRVTTRTVHYWDRGIRRPNKRNKEKLDRVVQVIDALGEMIYREDRIAFLMGKHPLLFPNPASYLDSTEDSAKVLGLIESIATGSFS